MIFVLSTGVILFFVLLAQGDEVRKALTKNFILLSMTLSLFLTFFAGYNRFGYDAGLYHLPYQLWMRKEPVVLGLANLHDRFGFNSILEAISALFWLSNNNFKLVSIVESLFFFFFYLTLLEFLLQDPGRYRGFSLAFSLLSPLSILILDDYFIYSITNTDAPAALASLLCVFSFLRLADKLGQNENVETEFLSLNVFAVFAIALKLSSVPILILAASSYVLLLRRNLGNLQYQVRVAFLSALFLIPTIFRSVALSGCLAFPMAFSCVSPLPWSAEHNAKIQADAITAWARTPGPGFWSSLTGWDWLPQWGEKHIELLILLMATTLVIFMFGYFYTHTSLRGNCQMESSKIEKISILSYIAIILVLFEGAALAFWFLNAPDVRFGILALHMFTLLPAFLTVSIVDIKPQPASGGSFLYKVLGILVIVSCILKISAPSLGKFVQEPHLYNFSIHVPAVETVPDPQYGVRPVKPDKYSCWITEEPCSPSAGIYREFDIRSIGPWKVFLRK